MRSNGGLRALKFAMLRSELRDRAHQLGFKEGKEEIPFSVLLETLCIVTVGTTAYTQDYKIEREALQEELMKQVVAQKLRAYCK